MALNSASLTTSEGPLAGRKGYSEIVQKFSLELIHALRSHDVGAVGRLFHDTGHLRM